MKLLDANIIIRFLTLDDKQKAQKCRKLFETAIAGKIKLFITDLTVAEVVWVLEKVYKLDKTNIRQKIEMVLNTANLIFQNREIILEAILHYDLYNIDFIDSYHRAFMRPLEIKEIFSYDKDFDVFEDLERIEP
jgi:predicted nucleic acid-binding protein